MGKKIVFVTSWFFGIHVLLLMLLTVARVRAERIYSAPSFLGENTNQSITASSGTAQVLGASVVAGDARVPLIEIFLQQHQSPIAPFADLIVQKADEYGLDFRLLPAIAMCESNLGKHIPRSDSFNAWGIACYTGQDEKCKQFTGWPHAIDWVSHYIKERYLDKGIADLRSISERWAPPSVANGYSWSNCVESFVNTIQ